MAILLNKLEFVNQAEVDLYEKLKGLEPDFTRVAVSSLDKMYSGFFSRNPVASGKSQKTSEAVVDTLNTPKLGTFIVWQFREDKSRARSWRDRKTKEIVTVNDYAIFFAEPLNPRNKNYKYGRRNVITSARDYFNKQLGI